MHNLYLLIIQLISQGRIQGVDCHPPFLGSFKLKIIKGNRAITETILSRSFRYCPFRLATPTPTPPPPPPPFPSCSKILDPPLYQIEVFHLPTPATPKSLWKQLPFIDLIHIQYTPYAAFLCCLWYSGSVPVRRGGSRLV